MGLTPGSLLGPYQIIAPIGAGGMGEVYRARDTRLDRDVAIKALPDAFSSDPDRLLCFEREAKLLASVSHPNLGAIYGIEEVDGLRFLILEYVEGETLAARLARGALPVEEAISFCLQIATGMEAAHEAGIVHRDLKPGNVMITPGDQVKVLDFGLARGKVVEWEEVSPESPTVTEMASPTALPGVSVGTARYLSPEQARGKSVDRRTDIWSFGCVLYECLTGRRAFEGETVSDVIAAVLGGEVEWERLPKGAPSRVRELLEHCLERDPRKRLRDMGDARLALEAIQEGKEPVPPSHPGIRVIAVAGLSVVVAGLVITFALQKGCLPPPPPDGGRPKRFEIRFPPSVKSVHGVVTSPDGQTLFATALPQDGLDGLYRRPIGGGEFERIAGSDGALLPHFTSDGRWAYFVLRVRGNTRGLRLMRIPTDRDAPPVRVADLSTTWAIWCAPLVSGDVLVATQPGTAYARIHVGGGAPSEPTPFDIPGVESEIYPVEALPGDRGVLVHASDGIGVIDPETGKGKILVRRGEWPRYAPTGHLLFVRANALLAVRFDLERLEIRGEPVPIRDHVGYFSISQQGILAYMQVGVGEDRRRLIVVDGGGNVTEWNTERREFGMRFAADPSGSRVAFAARDSGGVAGIWILERGTTPARRAIAIPGLDCLFPIWSPDGKQIAFLAMGKGGGWCVQSIEGGLPRNVCEVSTGQGFISNVSSWFPDGQALLGTELLAVGAAARLVRIEIPAEADSLSVPVPLDIEPAPSMAALGRFSPDGRWITYWAVGDGVYLVSYRPDGSLGMPRRLDSGSFPRWCRSGRQIFYISALPSGEGAWGVKSVSLEFEPSLTVSEPVRRWDGEELRLVGVGGTSGSQLEPWYDLLPDARLLGLQKGEDEGRPDHAEVVVDFFDEMKRKVRAAGG